MAASSSEVGEILRAHSEEFYARRGACPAMHDAVTVGAALQDGFVEFERVFVDFIRDGRYIKGEDVVVRASVKEMDAESFMKNLSRSIEDNNGI